MFNDLTFEQKRKLWYELGRELVMESRQNSRLKDDFYLCRSVMEDIVGYDPMRKTRMRPYPCLRYIIGDYLVGIGYTVKGVAKVLGLDRATLIHGLDCLPYILDDRTAKIKFNFNKRMYENEI